MISLELDDEAVAMIRELANTLGDTSYDIHLARKILELYEEQIEVLSDE